MSTTNFMATTVARVDRSAVGDSRFQPAARCGTLSEPGTLVRQVWYAGRTAGLVDAVIPIVDWMSAPLQFGVAIAVWVV